MAQFEETLKKTVSLGQKLDIVFTLIRLGFFYTDQELTQKSLTRADEMMEKVRCSASSLSPCRRCICSTLWCPSLRVATRENRW